MVFWTAPGRLGSGGHRSLTAQREALVPVGSAWFSVRLVSVSLPHQFRTATANRLQGRTAITLSPCCPETRLRAHQLARPNAHQPAPHHCHLLPPKLPN